MTILYLHGFASSPQSSKAQYLSARLAEHGHTLICPDLNEPDFATLTVTRMIADVRCAQERQPGPVVLIGSSLGAFVAVLAASELNRPGGPPRVGRLILLAPALEFGVTRMHLDEAAIARWRERDRLNVQHHAYERTVPLRFGLYVDAGRHDAFSAPLDVPVLIFQGRRDASVDPKSVERYAHGRANVVLHLLDDDHQLQSSLDVIWRESAAFVGLTPRAGD